MFAPIGYINISELLNSFTPFAQGYAAAYDWVDQTDNRPESDLSRHTELLAAWMLCCVFDSHDVFLASPSGMMARASGLLLRHEDDLARWMFPNNLKNPSPISSIFARGVSSPTDHPLNRFRFIDVFTGTVAVEGREGELSKFQIESDELILHQARVAKQFDCWAVCIHESALKPGCTDYKSLVFPDLYDELNSMSFEDGSSRGRPRKVDKALTAYKSRFPDGHGDLTWPEVAKEIETITNIPISDGTLSRAVNNDKKAYPNSTES